MSSGLMDVIWKPLGGVLSTLRDRLNPFWGLLEGFEVFWKILEARQRLGACLRRFWSILGRLGGVLARLGSVWAHLRKMVQTN